MRILALLMMTALASTEWAVAQNLAAGASGVEELVQVRGIARNSVSNMYAQGDTLWVGPFLNMTPDGGTSWFISDADSLLDTENRLFSIDAEDDLIWVGLGFSFQEVSGGRTQLIPSAGGFLLSENRGTTFNYRFPPLDFPGDSLVQYGRSVLTALPIIVPQQSPPYDIDYDPVRGQVWTAGWASGVRVSNDRGQTWNRVVLPPDDLDYIHPDSSYDFRLEPRRGQTGHFNHMGFSVLVDELGVVWAGTPAGINRSLDGGSSWQRFSHDGTPRSLTGSWVISIEEQPAVGRNPIWIASWNAAEAGEQGSNGITVTRDGGESFEQVLLGERIYDFAFRGDTIYAAGERGLFISADEGRTWNTVRDFVDPSRPDLVLRPDVEAFSTAVTPGAVWVGTSEGLLRSLDGGESWRAFRVDVPLDPDVPSASVPRVDTYAYPNPFSPASDRFVRLRYQADGQQAAEVRIFDFAMTLVRRLAGSQTSPGEREVVWDGRNEAGLRVPNGPYFYAIERGGDAVWGKILVLE